MSRRNTKKPNEIIAIILFDIFLSTKCDIYYTDVIIYFLKKGSDHPFWNF
jgi:hypothetical protein